MNDRRGLYEEAAEVIARSRDPAGELVRVAQLQSGLERRRRTASACVGLALLLGVVVGTWLLHEQERDGHPVGRDPMAESEWALGLLRRPASEGLSTEEERRLRRALYSHSSRQRRIALVSLSHFGLEVPVERLEQIASGLEETLDLPEEIASAGDSGVRQALLSKRLSTMRTVTRSMWFHAAKHGDYPALSTLERFSRHSDETVRHNAYRALGEVVGYVPTDDMRLRLEKDTERVRRAAKKLLRGD